MGKTVVNSKYQENSHYFTNRILNSKAASAKMRCFQVTLTMLLYIAVLMAVTLQAASANDCKGRACFTDADCHKDGCPESLKCYPGIDLLDGLIKNFCA